MRNLRYIVILLACLAFAVPASAIKAPRKTVEYVQPDGTRIRIRIHGDEFRHWVTTEDEKTVLKLDKDNFYRPGGTVPVLDANVRITRESTRRVREQNRASSALTQGSNHFLVLLIEFSDTKFTVSNPQQAFYNLLNQEGYSTNGGTGSARDYYYENSDGIFSPTFDVVGPITLSKSASYYGGNDAYGSDAHPDEALYEACQKVNAQVDFAEYDHDNDGYVDQVFYYYAGHNEAEGGGANTIWPHAWSLYYYSAYFDGVRVYDYACTSEYKNSIGSNMCGIGTFCHEFGHVIGLPDFYDTDYEKNGYGYAVYNFSLMDEGSYNNDGRTPPYLSAIERNLLGWMDKPTEIMTGGSYTLAPIRNKQAYRISTENPGEYFLLETRDYHSWDKYISNGMIVYHVDQSETKVHGMTARQRWDSWTGINCYSDHQCYYIVPAKDSYYSTSSYPFPGSSNVRTFQGTSWAGVENDIILNNISFDNTNVTFTVNASVINSVSGTVKDLWGNNLEGAKVTLASRTSSYRAETVTDWQGEYSFSLEGISDTEFTLSVTLQDYKDQEVAISVTKGGNTQNFVLFSVFDDNFTSLEKYGAYSSSTGWGKGISIMGAVKYTPEELTEYKGSAIQAISFYLADTGAASVVALVEIGKSRVLTQVVPDPVFGGWNTVNISSAGIVIPDNMDVYVGYGVNNPETGYPLAVDAGPWVEGGGYSARYSTSNATWQSLKSKGNLLVSAVLMGPANAVRANGYSYIDKDDAGEWEIVPGAGKVVDTVKWTETSSLIKAEVTYTDGAGDVIEMEL